MLALSRSTAIAWGKKQKEIQRCTLKLFRTVILFFNKVTSIIHYYNLIGTFMSQIFV